MIDSGSAVLIYSGEFFVLVCFKHSKTFGVFSANVEAHGQMKVRGFYMKK